MCCQPISVIKENDASQAGVVVCRRRISTRFFFFICVYPAQRFFPRKKFHWTTSVVRRCLVALRRGGAEARCHPCARHRKSRSLRVTTARTIGVHYGFTVHRITCIAGLPRIISSGGKTAKVFVVSQRRPYRAAGQGGANVKLR